jgi:hypothetical protein
MKMVELIWTRPPSKMEMEFLEIPNVIGLNIDI